MAMNKEDEKKFNSPSWWRLAIQTRPFLEQFVEVFKKQGLLALRTRLAEEGCEFTPDDLQSQYELTVKTLEKLDS